MKKLLLSAALIAAISAPAMADDYSFTLTSKCNEQGQPVDYTAVEEGKTYEVEPELLFNGMMMECAAYIIAENNTAEKVKCDIVLEEVYNNNVFGDNPVSWQTCLGGSCLSGNLSIEVDANSKTFGGYGEHIGYSMMASKGDVDALKFDAKYNVTVTMGTSFVRHFTLLYTNKSGSVESFETQGTATYYNLQGLPVSNPEKGGLYIVRQAGKVSKQIIK